LTCPHTTLPIHGQGSIRKVRRSCRGLIASGLSVILLGLWAFPANADPTSASLPAGGGPARIASVNLCSDQMLIALAEPAQIVAVGPLATDPALSYFADPARAFPRLANSAEALLRNPPDLLLLGRYDRPYLAAALQQRGVRLAVVDHWRSVEDTISGVREVSAVLGRPAAGERLSGEIGRALADLRLLRTRTAGTTFLILHKRGFVEAKGVLADALEQAGLQMAMLPGAGAAGSFSSAEAILAARPDILIAPQPTGRPADLAEALFEHRALTQAFPPDRRLLVPQSYALCPGPATPALLDHVREGLLAKLAVGGLQRRRGV
jgi:iron complex transport system substrate-binding protein